MNVSFRSVQARDMKPLRLTQDDWKKIQERRRWGMSRSSLPARVVTIDAQVVLAFDGTNQVCFQDDRFPIADLIRADKRVWEALATFDRYALADLKRERAGTPSAMDILRGWQS